MKNFLFVIDDNTRREAQQRLAISPVIFIIDRVSFD